jgi:tyrosyl-tRNA synthetase
MGEIARLEAGEGAAINLAKEVLATEATSLCHGADAAKAAADTARRVFVEGGIGNDLPVIEIERVELANGAALVRLLHRAGLAGSLGEARRLIRGGGARVNDAAVDDETRELRLDDLTSDGVIKLSAGRKRHALIRPV